MRSCYSVIYLYPWRNGITLATAVDADYLENTLIFYPWIWKDGYRQKKWRSREEGLDINYQTMEWKSIGFVRNIAPRWGKTLMCKLTVYYNSLDTPDNICSGVALFILFRTGRYCVFGWACFDWRSKSFENYHAKSYWLSLISLFYHLLGILKLIICFLDG